VALPRRPYAHVVRQLRQEVGFRCPVDDCGNPYLTWHHFDPPCGRNSIIALKG
jgi:hypothetical protein